MKKIIFGVLTLVVAVVIALLLVECDGMGGGKKKADGGMVTLAPGESLAKRNCDPNNKGEMVFVMDEAQAYECDEQGWVPVQKNKPVAAAVAPNDSNPEAEDREKLEKIKEGKNGRDSDDRNQERQEKKEGCEGRVVSSGVEVSCDGAPVDTVKKQNAAAEGTKCDVKDNNDGTASVKCAENDSAVVNKCGKDVYDPNGNKFCQNDTLQEKCGGKEYDTKSKVCEKGVLTEAKKVCGGAIYDATKQFCDFRDNRIYKYVKIGKGAAAQTWMAENLNYTVKPGSQSWCGGTYGSVEGNCEAYGRLYTWAATMGKSESACGKNHKCNVKNPLQGVCPAGWHVPTRMEWEKLFTNVGGMSVAGKMLKSVAGWSNDSRGSDSFLFNVLSGGYRINNGTFFGVGDDADFWTASEDGATNAYNIYVGNKTAEAYIFDYEKDFGFSVRCVKN